MKAVQGFSWDNPLCILSTILKDAVYAWNHGLVYDAFGILVWIHGFRVQGLGREWPPSQVCYTIPLSQLCFLLLQLGVRQFGSCIFVRKEWFHQQTWTRFRLEPVNATWLFWALLLCYFPACGVSFKIPRINWAADAS